MAFGMGTSGGIAVKRRSFTVADSLMQTVSGGGVTVKVTYLNPQSSEDLRFSVVLSTHWVALGAYDLNAIILI